MFIPINFKFLKWTIIGNVLLLCHQSNPSLKDLDNHIARNWPGHEATESFESIIHRVKAYRAMTGEGLKESRDYVFKLLGKEIPE